MSSISIILKRNGQQKPFESERISIAIEKAFLSENIINPEVVQNLTYSVVDMANILQSENKTILTVEEIQDLVEQTLMMNGYHKVARNYILYREKHAQARQEKNFQLIKENTLKIKVSESETTVYNPAQIEEYFRRISFDLYKIICKYNYSEKNENQLNSSFLKLNKDLEQIRFKLKKSVLYNVLKNNK